MVAHYFGSRLPLGLSAAAVFAAMIVLGMLAFSLIGWPLLPIHRQELRTEETERSSIILDSLCCSLAWSSPSAWRSKPAVDSNRAGGVRRLQLISGFGFRWALATRGASKATTLLQLRVFALGKRSERLFDRLRTHWQYAGSISMIGRPDLVTTTASPH